MSRYYLKWLRKKSNFPPTLFVYTLLRHAGVASYAAFYPEVVQPIINTPRFSKFLSFVGSKRSASERLLWHRVYRPWAAALYAIIII